VRYVLNDDVFENMLHAALKQPQCLLVGLRTLRAPHPLMWVEWCESRDGEAKRLRAGALIDADAAGRSGSITTAWMHDQAGPLQTPGQFFFDFDTAIGRGLGSYDIDRSDRSLYDAHDQLSRHVAFRPNCVWMEKLQSRLRGNALAGALNRLLATNVHDFPLLCAFLVLLSQPRVIERRPSQLEKLNAARARRGKAPLLGHIELHMCLSPAEGGLSRSYRNGARAPARRHWVRGHLVERDQCVFWRRSHTRGEPSAAGVLKRTIHVARG